MRLRVALVMLTVCGLGVSALGQQPGLLSDEARSGALPKSVLPNEAIRSRSALLQESLLPTARTRSG